MLSNFKPRCWENHGLVNLRLKVGKKKCHEQYKLEIQIQYFFVLVEIIVWKKIKIFLICFLKY